MKILIALNHPAHYHLFKNFTYEFRKRDHEIEYVIKQKDILEELLKSEGETYVKINEKKKLKSTTISILLEGFSELVRQNWHLLKHINKWKPDIMMGTDISITHVGKYKKIPSFVFNEDDIKYNQRFCYFSYPFASYIISPQSCGVGKFHKKKISYAGYHELAYLHPENFIPNKDKIRHLLKNRKRYFILRFSSFNACHDVGISGISNDLALNIVNILKPHGNIFITSERELIPNLEKYRLRLNFNDIHHALYYSDIYIGDSQSMAMEAAVLGVPSIRFNKFVDYFNVSVLDELEKKYKLTCSINANCPNKLEEKILEYLNTPSLKNKWHIKRKKMLSEKIDVSSFLVWFVENYPESVKIVKENECFKTNRIKEV
jgi:uncharacterized protein